jgi:GT2 family glycosyltransferase
LKKIAVVILNWNGEKLLNQFLPSVLLYSNEATIYVADNASSDYSLEILKNEFPTVKIIQNKANYGFARGYNECLEAVEEEIYCLLNSDVEVTENWLKPILSIFEEQPNTAIIQPKILDFNKKTHFEYAGAGGGFIDKYGYPYCRGRIFNSIEEDKGQYDDIKQIFWATGACFFIRKSVFRELKGFDADFFAHQEEIDLCWRSFNLNFDTFYCGLSTVYHVGGGTLNATNPKKTYLNFRNSLFMLTKNVPTASLFIVLFIRMILDGLAGIQFLFQFKFSHSIAILKAHFAFYKMLHKMYKKRKPISTKKYYLKSSIVASYFIKRQRKYC